MNYWREYDMFSGLDLALVAGRNELLSCRTNI